MEKICLLLVLFTTASCYIDKSVWEYIHDTQGYGFLTQSIVEVGLQHQLNETGPFTVFAPTDAAFNKLGAVTISNLFTNPSQLAFVIKNHILKKYVLVPMVNGPTHETTMNNGQLHLEPYNGGIIINNASIVSASANDIICDNGAIQPIDTVLIPSNLPSFTIMQYLIQDDTRFKDLALSIILASLTPTLENPDSMVFAPIDSAFFDYENKLLSDEEIKYHVVPGARKASELSDGQVLFSLQGTPLKVTINSSGVMINNARVIDADILCTNGLIHAIDAILIP